MIRKSSIIHIYADVVDSGHVEVGAGEVYAGVFHPEGGRTLIKSTIDIDGG